VAELSQVEVRGVYKDYGRRRALSNVSVRLLAGQVAVLLGENGAGKSTLLSILSTLSRPSRGEVRYGGQLLDALDPQSLRAQLGVLAHEPRCYGDLSARENLRFFGRLYGLGSAEQIAQQAERLLRRLGLVEAADRPVRTYSRGMLQRLAVGRTLLHQPGLLLLDEPYTGLDRGGVAVLTSLLLEERRRGAILLLISHDLEAVAPLCDRALLLRGGRLVADESYGSGASAAALAALYQGGGVPAGPAKELRP
jgi:ABC-type multidrug transport system ATPase subunit